MAMYLTDVSLFSGYDFLLLMLVIVRTYVVDFIKIVIRHYNDLLLSCSWFMIKSEEIS